MAKLQREIETGEQVVDEFTLANCFLGRLSGPVH